MSCNLFRLADFFDLSFDERLHLLFFGQLELVLRYKKLVVHACQGILDKSVILVCTEQNTNRQIVTLAHHVLPVPVHIGIELADVFMGKPVKLQFNQYMAFQNTMIEDQIDKKVFVPYQNAFLTGLETEPMTQLKEKILKLVDKHILKM